MQERQRDATRSAGTRLVGPGSEANMIHFDGKAWLKLCVDIKSMHICFRDHINGHQDAYIRESGGTIKKS